MSKLQVAMDSKNALYDAMNKFGIDLNAAIDDPQTIVEVQSNPSLLPKVQIAIMVHRELTKFAAALYHLTNPEHFEAGVQDILDEISNRPPSSVRQEDAFKDVLERLDKEQEEFIKQRGGKDIG